MACIHVSICQVSICWPGNSYLVLIEAAVVIVVVVVVVCVAVVYEDVFVVIVPTSGFVVVPAGVVVQVTVNLKGNCNVHIRGGVSGINYRLPDTIVYCKFTCFLRGREGIMYTRFFSPGDSKGIFDRSGEPNLALLTVLGSRSATIVTEFDLT